MTTSPKASTRVVLIDDHPTVRKALRTLLDTEGGFEVVGETENIAGAMKLVEDTMPEIAIVDISLRASVNGLGITTKLKFRYPELRILLLSLNAPADFSRLAYDAGADGYLSKSDVAECLVDALRTLNRGAKYGFTPAS